MRECIMKIRVGVFFGGNSVEHEISVISALQAMNAMDSEKYEIIPVYITRENEFYIGEALRTIENFADLPALLKQCRQVIPVKGKGCMELYKYPFGMFGNKPCAVLDVAFPIVHGTNVEDGTLQGFLKYLGAPVVGCDVIASAVGMDKYVMKTILKDAGVPVLDCIRFSRFEYEENEMACVEAVEAKFAYPVIVKPIDLGSSVGIKIGHDRDGLQEAIKYAFEYAGNILVEPAITQLREINCSVLGDTEQAIASACEEPAGSDEILSYKDKYMSSGASKGMASVKRKLPADLPAEQYALVQQLAVTTFQALRCNGVVRIDFMIDGATNQVYVNEINTIPGSLAFYLWKESGIEYKELLDRLIKLALKRERENKAIRYDFKTDILKGFSFGGTKGGKLGGKMGAKF